MKTTTRKTLHKDEACRIFEAAGELHVEAEGRIFTPTPIAYRGFTARDFASLRVELSGSGIPDAIAALWVHQAQGGRI